MDTAIDKPSSVATRPPADGAGENDGQAWKQLRYLNHYRILLAGLFFAFVASGTLPAPLGSHHPRVFQWTSGIYLALALASTLAIHRRWFPFKVQVHGHVLLDIAAITLMMYASGGVRSGLGMLLVVAVAGGSLLTEGRTARLFAAIATLAVLSEQLYNKLEGSLPASYTQAGLLGAGFFATAILAHGLARRLRESEALAERRGVDLANMAQLTEYIIQRMQTGILVIDGNGRIRLANHSARALLDNPRLEAGENLSTAAPPLAEQMRRWEQDPEAPPSPFRATPAGAALLPRFARLGSASGSGILVFLEDTAATTQQAQQMKLASLGRLTASIAHEIRNPLGAISHAGQLLAESPHLDTSDLRLTQIIREHSRRVNTIIENILQLGRGGRSQPETLHLLPWLEQFVAGFCLSEQLDPDRIRLEIHPADTCICVDAGQLHQILWNLCHNGIHHGGGTPRGRLILRGGLSRDTHSPFLEIIDNGPGIRAQDMEHIFEPFFTTADGGTGLGLYIARELCEGNQARLHCLPKEDGACFRIVFADPRRRQVA